MGKKAGASKSSGSAGKNSGGKSKNSSGSAGKNTSSSGSNGKNGGHPEGNSSPPGGDQGQAPGNNRFNSPSGSGNNDNIILKNTEKKNLFDDISSNVAIAKLRQLLDQPCFVMPSTVRDNYYENPNIFMKGVKVFSTLGWKTEVDYTTSRQFEALKSIIGELISFFTFNPFLYWYRKQSNTWGGPLISFEIFTKNFVTKFLYCIFKVFGSPLILVLILFVLFIYFLKALDLLRLGQALAHTLAFTFALLLICTIVFAPVGLNLAQNLLNQQRDYYNFDGKTFDPTPVPAPRLPFIDPIIFFFGSIIPFHIFHPALGKNIGYGGVGILIVIFTILSYILIFLGGINILFIGGVFVFYLFKLIQGLKGATTGQ